MTAFYKGGIVMWPLLAVAVGIVYLAVRTAWHLHRGRVAAGEVQRSLQGILFWGAMSVLLGLLGTVAGFVVMTQAAALAGSVQAPLIWGGVGVSLITLISGLAIFILAATLWFGLRQWLASVEARSDSRLA